MGTSTAAYHNTCKLVSGRKALASWPDIQALHKMYSTTMSWCR